MAPLAKATIVVMPVCKATLMAAPAPAHDKEGNLGGGEGKNDTLAGWLVRCGKFAMIGLVLLGLVAMGVIVTVVVMMVGFKQDDPVIIATNTSSTAMIASIISTDTASTAIGSTSSTAILTSTSSMTMPKINIEIE
jgi:hypothetical protein